MTPSARTQPSLRLVPGTVSPTPSRSYWFRAETNSTCMSSAQTFRLNKKFPYAKAWWRNVERDPRVRLKIGGKIYEMTVVLIQDRAEVARLRGGRDPIVKETVADGNEYITEEWHYWRVYQRNVPEYGTGLAVAASK